MNQARNSPLRVFQEGRFWTEDGLRAAAGTGQLTPSLEEELRWLGIL